jgi:hypothetical protein
MSRRWSSKKLVVTIQFFLALLPGCPDGGQNNCPSRSALGQPKDKVDILFVIDDSSSMTPKQDELKTRFPELIESLDDFAAQGHPIDYHFGVVTSDLGAGPGGSGGSGCTAGGLGAALQPLGRGHAGSCAPPTGGLNFIDYNQIKKTNNLPSGQSLAQTFSCIASVGTAGCGFEHQLEAAYRALHDCQTDATCTITENRGFLRTDALLVVIFLTDEDDCSAPPMTDLFESSSSNFGAKRSYRCSNYGVLCNGQLMAYGDSGGPVAGCVPAPNSNGNLSGLPPVGEGKLFDVNRYVGFFMSLKADPNDVILAALDAPSAPVQSSLLRDTDTPCDTVSNTCGVTLHHSCVSQISPGIFGDPAVRINTVIGSVMNGRTWSICADDYGAAMTMLAQSIETQVMGGSVGNTTGAGNTGGTGGTGGNTSGTAGMGGGSCGGSADNVAACNAFVQKVKCGSADISMYINCATYSATPCDLSDYFNCLAPKFVCVNGAYDTTKEATISECAQLATCH